MRSLVISIFLYACESLTLTAELEKRAQAFEMRCYRRRGGKTISKSGQEWTLPAQLGQLKTGQDGKGLLQIHLWCPDDLSRLWDRIE